MTEQNLKLNVEVTNFLDKLQHPLRTEIESLRENILSSNPALSENIKWNAPNYCHNGEDRITMKIQPPKQIQVIFHRGAKVITQPKTNLISDQSNLLTWKSNDRAVASFKDINDVKSNSKNLIDIVNKWLEAAS